MKVYVVSQNNYFADDGELIDEARVVKVFSNRGSAEAFIKEVIKDDDFYDLSDATYTVDEFEVK